MKTKLTITIEKEVLKKFKEFCELQGYKVSTKIGKLIEEFLKDKNIK
ncbi:MAG TPA: DUF6364 family protein [Candidatus Nanoarchaeia archaeon]|nr:DUF6364 family protein [Candidatus Nanoarchaeia archaeon]